MFQIKVLPIVALVLVVLIVGTTAYAGQQDWRYALQAGPDTVVYSMVTVGVSPDASDNYDSRDVIDTDFAVLRIGIYHSTAEGWTGTEGLYATDIRQPFSTQDTWANIYLWWTDPVQPSYGDTLYFHPYESAPPPANYQFTLYLDQVPNGVTYTGPWSWQLPNTGQLIIPAGTFTPFASETGLDSYRFHLTVTAVPEPSSLLALLGTLGTAGVALLRRRG